MIEYKGLVDRLRKLYEDDVESIVFRLTDFLQLSREEAFGILNEDWGNMTQIMKKQKMAEVASWNKK